MIGKIDSKEVEELKPQSKPTKSIIKKLDKITIIQALEEAKKLKPQSEPTKSIIKNLDQIKAICDNKYYEIRFYGATSLNRMIVRDKEIAELLTSDVLQYIFTNKNACTLTRRDTTITLKNVISDGLAEGLEALKYMTANEHNMSEDNYKIQKQNFEDNTIKIIQNIGKVIGQEIDTTVKQPDTSELLEQFERVCRKISTIKINNSKKLLYVNTFSTDTMREQACNGFGMLCIILVQDKDFSDLEIFRNSTQLEDLAKSFLSTPKALLNGDVIHCFYDRAHIEAALEQDITYKFKDGDFTFEDIFRKMVEELCKDPLQYPIAVEQFVTRFNLVEVDLSKRFPEESFDSKLKAISDEYLKELRKKLDKVKQSNDKLSVQRVNKLNKCIEAVEILHNCIEQKNPQNLIVELQKTIQICEKNKTNFRDRQWSEVLTHMINKIMQRIGWYKVPEIKRSFKALLEFQRLETQNTLEKN